jgi:hypothetical protein
MNKILLIFVIFLVSFSFVFANGNNPNDDDINSSDDQPGNGNQYGTLTAVSVGGTYVNGNGKEMKIEKVQNKNRLRVGNVSAEYSFELEQEASLTGTKLRAKLSNGQNAEIKIMPNVASERALERLRLKVCQEEQGCKIVLKEVGQGEELEAAYELEADKEAKVLGMFKTKMKVRAQVSAESGEVIRVHKPWWAFLASETDELEEAEE